MVDCRSMVDRRRAGVAPQSCELEGRQCRGIACSGVGSPFRPAALPVRPISPSHTRTHARAHAFPPRKPVRSGRPIFRPPAACRHAPPLERTPDRRPAAPPIPAPSRPLSGPHARACRASQDRTLATSPPLHVSPCAGGAPSNSRASGTLGPRSPRARRSSTIGPRLQSTVSPGLSIAPSGSTAWPGRAASRGQISSGEGGWGGPGRTAIVACSAHSASGHPSTIGDRTHAAVIASSARGPEA